MDVMPLEMAIEVREEQSWKARSETFLALEGMIKLWQAE